MKIAIVTSEAVPFSKTGGLADAAGALFGEYLKMGIEAYLFIPLYGVTKERFQRVIQDTGLEMTVPLGNDAVPCKVYAVNVHDTRLDTESLSPAEPASQQLSTGSGGVFLVGNDEFFDRDELYGTGDGEYPDNDRRFAFFCRAVFETCKALGIAVDVLHCNDWQTGLVPAYLKTAYRDVPVFNKTRSVFTIHNLGYQGIFPASAMEAAGLRWDLFTPEGIEFYGKVNFLKAGIVWADAVTTVSETYAKEILTPELGFGLDGVLRKRAGDLFGVLNGVDYREWDPSTDRLLPVPYSPDELPGKAKAKIELMKKGSLTGKVNAPLLAFVGRLSGQKGIALLAEVVPRIVSLGGLVVIIGKGEPALQTLLGGIGAQHPRRVFLYAGFDEAFAHLAYAGSDMFLMPSLYEPCGLGQMIAMRYGSIPVAHKTGGPSDTIDPVLDLEKVCCQGFFGELTETGFLFDGYSANALLTEIKRAFCAFGHKGSWLKLTRNAMLKEFSWEKCANRYLEIYSGIMR